MVSFAWFYANKLILRQYFPAIVSIPKFDIVALSVTMACSELRAGNAGARNVLCS